MDSNLIIVKALINGVLFKPIFINTDYKYYSIVNKNFIINLWLLCVIILPKSITGFIKKNTKEPRVEITKIVKFLINI